MKYIVASFLCVMIFASCNSDNSSDKSKFRVFKVKFPSTFPFGRNEHLDGLKLKIGEKVISYDNPNEEILLSFTDTPDTLYFKSTVGKEYSFVLAKFKNGEVYSINYNDCEGAFQMHPQVDTDLYVDYRIKVYNLSKGDTLEVKPLFGDNFFITDSSSTNWGRMTFSANCNNSFKYLLIDRVFRVKKRCEKNDSSWCYLEADSSFNLEQISFQQLHNERLDIEYDYMTRKLQIKMK